MEEVRTKSNQSDFMKIMCLQLLEIKACKEKCSREFEAIQKQVRQQGCLGMWVRSDKLC